jgi:hypothetical protein
MINILNNLDNVQSINLNELKEYYDNLKIISKKLLDLIDVVEVYNTDQKIKVLLPDNIKDLENYQVDLSKEDLFHLEK